jgi:Fe-S-cluster-containing dehydrogenase component/anaerobic selenocysteine-containing dehydrogenase
MSEPSNSEPAPLGFDRPWRSLEERDARAGAAHEHVHEHGHGHAHGAGAASASPANSLLSSVELARRDFLQLVGGSLAAVGAAACTRQPDERIHPYAKSPEALIPGKPLYFATAMPWSSGALGLLVESHMGRPTKIEGNPDHPASLGATDAFAQAAVLELYDPARAQLFKRNGAISTWSAFLDEFSAAAQSQRASAGAGLRILTPTVISPTLAAQLASLLRELPKARWVSWTPHNRDQARAGALAALGVDVVAQPDFARAKVVLALDADFLAGPGGVRAARDFASARRARRETTSIAKLYSLESSLSITGAAADERLPARPSLLAAVASRIASRVGVATAALPLAPEQERWADRVAADLAAHRGECVVVAGLEQPAELHALAHAMNHALGAVGRTVSYTEPVEFAPGDQHEGLRTLVADLAAGRVDLLVVLEGNPIYDTPADLGFRAAFEKAKLRVTLSLFDNETTALSHWHVPAAHFLESWSDARAFDGTVSIQQPLIAPLYGGRSAHELLAVLAGQPTAKAYDLVRAHWQAQHEDDDFESYWKRSLHDGKLAGRRFSARSVSLADAKPNLARLAAPQDAAGLEYVLRVDPAVHDGRFADNAWLQECPRPLTKITWDNALLIGVATARTLGLVSGDVVECAIDGVKLEAPVWVAPGHSEQCVTLPLGYGRAVAGPIGAGVGFNAYFASRQGARWSGSGASLVKLGRAHAFATTQEHHDMERRDLVRTRELGALERGPKAPLAAHGETSMYPPFKYDGVAFGMVIDLNSCIGCNACVIACQSENTIPVVGKEQIAAGREMHWLRIDRYYEGAPENPRVLLQPVPCMHCEAAPCEVVCPVGATTHSPEGLNEMTYNRCVGTRYCSNNCPYKVRRFNFLAYTDLETESLKLGRNPDVTVRTRGVMEKCTYCVQRIQEKRIGARREGREVGGDEIVTACQQVCPAQAIVFGDINNEASAVAKLRAEPHHYGLLEELNTKPRTTYLAKVVAPSAAGEARDAGAPGAEGEEGGR